jgi:hypothetical protein
MRILFTLLVLAVLCLCLTGCDEETWSASSGLPDPYGPAEQ